eukprot:3943525-Alexandrium_andersonii.AAC.1
MLTNDISGPSASPTLRTRFTRRRLISTTRKKARPCLSKSSARGSILSCGAPASPAAGPRA